MLRTFLGTAQTFSKKAQQPINVNQTSRVQPAVCTHQEKVLGSKPTSVLQSQTEEIWTSLPSNQTGSQIHWTKLDHHCTEFKHSDGNQSTYPTQQLDKALHTKIGLLCLGMYTTLSSPQISSQKRDNAMPCKLKNISESTRLHKSAQPQGPLSHQRERDGTTPYKWKHISKSTQHQESSQPHVPLSHQREMQINITVATTSLV
jgi:hypothetical protein